MKEKIKFRLGKNAQRILLVALPVMIALSFGLTLHIARLDGIAVLCQREAILFSLETLSRISVCIALGTVLSDYAEKRTSAD